MELALIGIGLILDRLLKVLALNGEIEISKNKGLFFFKINQEWLIGGAGLILMILLVQLIKAWKKQDKYLLIGLWLIILGGFSNLFDRIVYGYVIDMFELLSFSVFNIADVMVIGGCALILIKVLKSERK